MTIRLTIRTAMWRGHVAGVANRVDGLVPVVKGNGYGFGRQWLAGIAAEFSDTVAVGTVHELGGLPATADAVVLTPTLAPPTTTDPILTVGSTEHIAALDGWAGRVLVKLASPMRRFGRDPALVGEARRAGLDVVGVSIHPPLAGTDTEHRDHVVGALAGIDPELPVWLSHLDLDTYAALPDTHRYRLRLGTALWHGNKAFLHLGADVLDVRPVHAGDRAGYRQVEIAQDGHLVMIGAGSAGGVAALADGRSPFHHARHRLPLIEPPHMHTSMAFVPDGDPVPAIGELVDLQRPLITTAVDDYVWL
jgi:alanine racemase